MDEEEGDISASDGRSDRPCYHGVNDAVYSYLPRGNRVAAGGLMPNLLCVCMRAFVAGCRVETSVCVCKVRSPLPGVCLPE